MKTRCRSYRSLPVPILPPRRKLKVRGENDFPRVTMRRISVLIYCVSQILIETPPFILKKDNATEVETQCLASSTYIEKTPNTSESCLDQLEKTIQDLQHRLAFNSYVMEDN
ncbi:hypothetical protein STEG23_012637 [Scotinomys teguina]